MPRAVRRAFAKLVFAHVSRTAIVAAALCCSLPSLAEAAPAPQSQRTAPAVQRSYRPRVPRTPEHAEYVVEVNRKGQVARVRSGKPSADLAFNTMTYGNALQAFIRTSDGRALAGIYRLTYDYTPKTQNVHRSVALLRAGGVNGNAVGAVDQMTADARNEQLQAGPSPKPLPDFESIEKSH